ncbi:hypothetical protein B0J13DRAFT_629122 [Dactylonectria estremocensis]|uniref:Uncharacterized protein n=1 Tax=Dactylonectria estremocensis TaxID=1079267 RepID=A0A9P9II71_9HYPO|nr:hypothetical protein B0J13DRAFT_629122 [Dactylonectria estremocensis]
MKFSLFYVVLPLGMIQSVAAIDWGRMCDGKSGQGDCATFRSDVSGKCVSFSGKDNFWNDKIDYVDVTRGTCFFYEHFGCNGVSIGLRAPRAINLLDFSNRASSFRCDL